MSNAINLSDTQLKQQELNAEVMQYARTTVGSAPTGVGLFDLDPTKVSALAGELRDALKGLSRAHPMHYLLQAIEAVWGAMKGLGGGPFPNH